MWCKAFEHGDGGGVPDVLPHIIDVALQNATDMMAVEYMFE